MVGSGCEWLQKQVVVARCEWWVPLARGKYWVPEANDGHWRQPAVAIVECQRQMVGGGVQWQVAEANGGWQKQMVGAGASSGH